MNIVFRVDSSLKIGSGHVMRCLTLAKILEEYCNVYFICRNRNGNLIELIQAEGFPVFELSKKALKDNLDESSEVDWLGTSQEQDILDCKNILKKINPDLIIIDHYGIDNLWHEKVYKFTKKIMVIDDLANRFYNCDILLDQNFYPDAEDRYKNLVQSNCKLLLGPKYALLRKEFFNESRTLRNSNIKKVLVYFGGSHVEDNILKTLKGIKISKYVNLHVDVILGKDFIRKRDIINFSSNMKNVVIYDYVDNMAKMMSNSDLYIGSAGTTTWERSCSGLPSIVISIAQNQIEPMQSMQEAGFSLFLGSEDKVSPEDISQKLNYFLDNPMALKTMSKRNLELVDGKGAHRCVEEILGKK